MKKNPYGRILKEKPKEQRLNTVLKSCPFRKMFSKMKPLKFFPSF